MIRTPQQLVDAREELGWTMKDMGRFLGLATTPGDRVRAMEAGQRPIGGPTATAVELALILHRRGLGHLIPLPE